MDHLPETPYQLMLLHPSALPGGILTDRMARFRCRAASPHTLRLTGNLEAGRYQMRMLMRSGGFDVDTLMLRLKQWPDGHDVEAGPFDFDHTSYRMMVPTFRVKVNGINYGLVWCEVPSPRDMTLRRIRALWAIEVARSGETTIELSVSPHDRNRLHWQELAEVDMIEDDRYSLPLPESVSRRPLHPRLLADEETFSRLSGAADPVTKILCSRLSTRTASGRNGTYEYRGIALPLLARIENNTEWAEEAIERAMKLVSRKEWGYHDNPGIMGWNNDRDAGNRMLEVAVIFDWLYDRLSEDQRGQIVEKLAHHAGIAYGSTLIQKNYWYHRACEAHGQGLWCGLTAAAAALLGHDERAVKWLEWTLGGFDDAARHLQADGVSTWYTFNVNWHIYTLAILEKLVGRRLEGDYPFFRSFPGRVLQVLNPESIDTTLATLLFYMARREQSPRIQADALRLMGIEPASDADPHPALVTSLAPLFYDPDVPPGDGQPILPAICTERGIVSCRAGNGSRFVFECGTGPTAAQHAAHNFINRWYGISGAGSFQWVLESKRLKGRRRHGLANPMLLAGYKKCTRHANLITIDGRGHLLEGRWLGSTVPLKRVAFIEHCAGDRDVTYCFGNSSFACADDLEVKRLCREWLFFHDTGILIMRDHVQTAGPRLYAWHIHSRRSPWKQTGPLSFSMTSGGHSLAVRALAAAVDGDVSTAPADLLQAAVEDSEFVPTYTTGVNTYKTLDWQPELRPEKIDIPPYPDLQFAPHAKAADWRLVTAMGIDVETGGFRPEFTAGGLRIHGLPAGGEVILPVDDRLVLPGSERELTAAAAARPYAGAPWRCFNVRRWRMGEGDWTVVQTAGDMLWDDACDRPDKMQLVTAMPPACSGGRKTVG